MDFIELATSELKGIEAVAVEIAKLRTTAAAATAAALTSIAQLLRSSSYDGTIHIAALQP